MDVACDRNRSNWLLEHIEFFLRFPAVCCHPDGRAKHDQAKWEHWDDVKLEHPRNVTIADNLDYEGHFEEGREHVKEL